MEGLTEIEKIRNNNILRNNERFAAIGIDPEGIARTCLNLLCSPPSSRQKRVQPSLLPFSIQLRARGARPQYCDRINNEDTCANSAASSDSYTPSNSETMSNAGDGTMAAQPPADEEHDDKVTEWDTHLEEVS